MIPIVNIDDIASLVSSFNNLSNSYIYRGHANSLWRIESSLERVLGDQWSREAVRRFEDFSLQIFRAKFHLYDSENVQPDSKLAWLSLMQHYGVPTRLVDFTESPYVALYFALEAYQPAAKADLAVYALRYSALMDASIKYIEDRHSDFRESRVTLYPKQDQVFDDFVDKVSYDIAWVTEPRSHNRRLDRQGGCFLLSGNRDIRIEAVLQSPTYAPDVITKYVINHSLYPAVFALLRKMNLTSKTLYGDLEGLARSIKMELQVYSTA